MLAWAACASACWRLADVSMVGRAAALRRICPPGAIKRGCGVKAVAVDVLACWYSCVGC